MTQVALDAARFPRKRPSTSRDWSTNFRIHTSTLIRSFAFDSAFIAGPVLIGFVVSTIVLLKSSWFAAVLAIDLWALGYHHVVATYTRLYFDKQSFIRFRWLACDLAVLTVLLTYWMSVSGPAWLIPTIYLYAQWFHYMRQSYGIARIYEHLAGIHRPPSFATRLIIYAPAIAGILRLSSTAPTVFLGMPIKTLFVTRTLTIGLYAVTIASLIPLVLNAATSMRRTRCLAGWHWYLASHAVVFFAAYFINDDVNRGWLLINAWHNSQYIAFVWHHNNRRFTRTDVDLTTMISYISQSDRIILYLFTCILVSTALYSGLSLAASAFGIGNLQLLITMYMAINFHHYIVDAVIWKRRQIQ